MLKTISSLSDFTENINDNFKEKVRLSANYGKYFVDQVLCYHLLIYGKFILVTIFLLHRYVLLQILCKHPMEEIKFVLSSKICKKQNSYLFYLNYFKADHILI